MPRKESKRLREIREAQLAEDESIDTQVIDEIPEIARLRESLGDGQFTVRIQRKGEDGLFEKFPSLPLESFDPDAIAAKYGGGLYKFDVIDGSGVYVKRFSAAYSKLLKPKSEETSNGAKSLLASPEFALIQQMQESTRQQMQMMNQQVLTMMGEVVKAVSSKPAGPDFKEMILALKGLKDLGGGDVAGEMVKGALGMASKFLEMGRESATAIDPESNIMNKLLEFLPGLVSKLGERPASPPAPIPARAQDTEIVPQPPALAPVELPKPEVYKKYPNVSLMIRQLGVRLVELAKADTDVKQTAQELVSGIPENFDSEVDSFVRDPRAVDLIIEVFPPLSLYVDWLRKFIKAIDEEFQDEIVQTQQPGIAA